MPSSLPVSSSKTMAAVVPLILGLLFIIDISAAEVTVRTVDYKRWKNNLQLSNGSVEVVITLDVGPRIIRYGYVGEANIFAEFEEQLGKSGETEWQIRGGHRLWHAPEDLKRTYALDNSAVRYERLGNSSVRVIQPQESITGVQKEMDITLDPNSSQVTVVHRLRNGGLWEIELAPWALSAMAPGGALIVPLPPKTPHPQGVVPNQQMIIWPYTDLADSRYRFGTKYIVLKQDKSRGPTKIGLAHQLGWAAYLRDGYLFVKGYQHQPGKQYPDFGCNLETFTNERMLELESLGPLSRIAPAAAVEHTEHWWLFKGIPNETSDEAIDANIRKRAENVVRP
ncbi:MAG TPA: hypothetical protein VGL91_22230 [Acidobacteriota bacterium]|jgi:hypothetical protein